MNRYLAVVGMILSVVYLAFAFWLVGGKLSGLQGMELNAIGDFFAGMFGPLSILWLVLGFFQQGLELRQNNEALRLQAQELKNAVDQQKEMVGIAGRQLEAELDNVRYSREQLDFESRPRLKFSAKVPSAMNNVMSVNFDIQNVGGDAEDVVISVNGLVARSKSIISGERIGFVFEFYGVDREYDMSVECVYGGGKTLREEYSVSVVLSKPGSGIADIDFIKK